MKPATAVAPDDKVGVRMNVHNAADTGEIVSLQLSHEVDVPVLRVPDLDLPGPGHGPREEDVVGGRVPVEPERGQPTPRLVVVVDLGIEARPIRAFENENGCMPAPMSITSVFGL